MYKSSGLSVTEKQLMLKTRFRDANSTKPVRNQTKQSKNVYNMLMVADPNLTINND